MLAIPFYLKMKLFTISNFFIKKTFVFVTKTTTSYVQQIDSIVYKQKQPEMVRSSTSLYMDIWFVKWFSQGFLTFNKEEMVTWGKGFRDTTVKESKTKYLAHIPKHQKQMDRMQSAHTLLIWMKMTFWSSGTEGKESKLPRERSGGTINFQTQKLKEAVNDMKMKFAMITFSAWP